MGLGKGKGFAMVQGVALSQRTLLIGFGLSVMLCSSAVFLRVGEGFYGTTFLTVGEALARPSTGPLSDDVYPCSHLNGLGSDDDVAIAALWLLFPLLVWRLWNSRTPASWMEAVGFVALTLPAVLFAMDAYCANIRLTLAVGNSVPLIGCLVGWTVAASAYLWPFRDS